MAEFLLEIGLEEVPARMLAGAQAELRKRTLALLEREHLLEGQGAAESYSTPRRLAVRVQGVLARQPDSSEEITGPALKIAYKDGQPTPAASAFARKAGVAVEQLRTISTPKGEYLAATTSHRGRTAAEVIAGELPREIAAIYWPKSMYWRAGKPERFVRPVLWIACLLGDEVLALSFAGKTAGRASYGHRVLSELRDAAGRPEPFEIVAAESYVAQLEGEFVLADVEARRRRIRKALDRKTRVVPGARWREDEILVDSVTHLTEWPAVLLGGFEPAFLDLPEEVLVTVMRDHQKYFAVEDAAGRLAPYFLAVVNVELDEENEPIIRQGNERVLRARFNDARFFWEFDQRIPLTGRVALLEHVTFQKDLGTYAAKSQRVGTLAARLTQQAGSRGALIDAAGIDQAARLAKTDLTTELVKEFTELQGMIGGLYARAQGLSATVADAIYDQYLPASARDALPRSPEGTLLGLADRIDTIAGLFALGMEPTGSKDPFALRRAANAVVRLLAESGLPLTLGDVIAAAEPAPELETRLRAFLAERVEFYLREVCGQAYDVVKAVMTAGYDDLRDAAARVRALTAVRPEADFLAVSAAFRRMKNILQQASDRGIAIPGAVNDLLLTEPAEMEFSRRAHTVLDRVEDLREEANYDAALEQVASLRPAVDDFFDKIMVMSPDEALRANRLALLSLAIHDFSRIADFSEIVVAG